MKEYEAAGKIRRVDAYVPEDHDMTAEEEDNAEDKHKNREWNVYKHDLGDGNFRHFHRPKE